MVSNLETPYGSYEPPLRLPNLFPYFLNVCEPFGVLCRQKPDLKILNQNRLSEKEVSQCALSNFTDSIAPT